MNIVREAFILQISQHEGDDQHWFFTIDNQGDGKRISTGSDCKNRHDAMLEATCWLNSQNQKPKEK